MKEYDLYGLVTLLLPVANATISNSQRYKER